MKGELLIDVGILHGAIRSGLEAWFEDLVKGASGASRVKQNLGSLVKVRTVVVSAQPPASAPTAPAPAAPITYTVLNVSKS